MDECWDGRVLIDMFKTIFSLFLSRFLYCRHCVSEWACVYVYVCAWVCVVVHSVTQPFTWSVQQCSCPLFLFSSPTTLFLLQQFQYRLVSFEIAFHTLQLPFVPCQPGFRLCSPFRDGQVLSSRFLFLSQQPVKVLFVHCHAFLDSLDGPFVLQDPNFCSFLAFFQCHVG